MICKKCAHRRCLTRNRSGGHCIVWKCGAIKDLWFGYQFEYDAGNNMPKKCDKFQELKWK